MAKKISDKERILKLRVGDLLMNHDDQLGMIVELMPELYAYRVHWFLENDMRLATSRLAEIWRKKVLDRRSDFL